MASGYSSSISGNRLGAKIRFYYSTSYNAATNTSTVSVSPELYTTALTGGANGWGGDVYGNGSSIYSLSSNYYSGPLLIAANGQETWLDFSPNSGRISSFSVAHDNSGNATFTLGYYGNVRAMYDGTTANFYSSTGISVTISEGRQLYVSYNANGGSGAPSATYFYGSTENIVLSSTKPTKDGYTFLGWSINSTASNVTYSPGQNIGKRSSNLILYAVWEINTWTISYNANGGENAPNSQTKIYNQTLVLSNSIPIYIGRDFLGWSTDPEATSAMYQAGGNYTKNEAAILYAVWGAKQYMLSIITSPNGVTSQISRVSSPLGNGSIGEITNGATLYYNDVLSINYTIGGVYQLISATVNNIDISDNVPYSLTVNSNVVVNISVKLGAIVYIGNEAYQAFIGTLVNGNVIWQQYQAFIGNGSTYDQY